MGHRSDPDLRTTGLHHITAICSDGRENKRFYTQVLNLRFVKKTVNQDDVSAYHLYYGDETGSPGTILTFFTWKLPSGTVGSPMASSITFSADDLSAWREHLGAHGVAFTELERFSTPMLRLTDPDGLVLFLLEHAMPQRSAVGTPTIRGICGVELSVADPGTSAGLLEGFGYERTVEDAGVVRFVHADSSTFVDLRADPSRGEQGAGSIHHVSFGVDPEDHETMRAALVRAGLRPTPIVERFYFRSIYFHERSGVLFEIATNGPGFGIDEEVLGSTLVLPPWLEPHRARIEEVLPDL